MKLISECSNLAVRRYSLLKQYAPAIYHITWELVMVGNLFESMKAHLNFRRKQSELGNNEPFVALHERNVGRLRFANKHDYPFITGDSLNGWSRDSVIGRSNGWEKLGS
ncbi:hypothetical protein CFB43_25125 [Burkholderia sp. AU15512]|nr:hypothetical protein CFB43_25125 [Burkholderia sp. AU15512]